MLGIGALCIVLLLGGCGGDDNAAPANPSNPSNPSTPGGTTPAACTTAHCAPAP